MENELYHHGIKGQKWGKRRYQNPDGSLTPEGEKRYGSNKSENEKVHDDYKEAHTKSNVKSMSTEELRKKNQRLEEENKYNRLNPKEKSKLEKSKDAVDTAERSVKSLKELERQTRPTPKKIRLDLSKMTDQELRETIERERLERQYNDYFAPMEPTNPRREKIQRFLDTAGNVLMVGSSALGIALAIKQLKGE